MLPCIDKIVKLRPTPHILSTMYSEHHINWPPMQWNQWSLHHSSRVILPRFQTVRCTHSKAVNLSACHIHSVGTTQLCPIEALNCTTWDGHWDFLLIMTTNARQTTIQRTTRHKRRRSIHDSWFNVFITEINIVTTSNALRRLVRYKVSFALQNITIPCCISQQQQQQQISIIHLLQFCVKSSVISPTTILWRHWCKSSHVA